MRPLVCALIALFLATPTALPQAKASIEGVVRSDIGEPIAGAQVRVIRGGVAQLTLLPSGVPVEFGGPTGQPVEVPPVRTDKDGRFVFKDLDADVYRVVAYATGYASQEYDSPAPGISGSGSAVNLDDGQAAREVIIAMVRAGSVTGRVIQNNGSPVPGIPVWLVQDAYATDGRKMLEPVWTDDRGMFRLFDITPGTYFLGAGGLSQRAGALVRATYSPIYYPSARDRSHATLVQVPPGVEVVGMNFVLSQQTFHVSGRIVDQTGQGTSLKYTISITIESPQGSRESRSLSSYYNAQDGTWDIPNLPSGAFLITAAAYDLQSRTTTLGTSPIPTLAPLGIADDVIAVTNSDVTGVTLAIQKAVSVSGQIHVEGDKNVSELSGAKVHLRRLRTGLPLDGSSISPQLSPQTFGADGSPALLGWQGATSGISVTQRQAQGGIVLGSPASPSFASPRPDGSLRFEGVNPGEYRPFLQLPDGFYLKDIRYKDASVLDQPVMITDSEGLLEVFVSARPGTLGGTLRNTQGQPLPNAQVVLIPNLHRDRTDLYKIGITDRQGRFKIKNLAPGDYKVFSWEYLAPYSYFDPSVIERFEPQGAAVHISEFNHAEINVRVIPF